MPKFLTVLKDRAIGSPLSTLVGALIGALNLGMHTAATNIDWSNIKQAAIAGASTIIPAVVGAMMKSAPQLDPQTAAIAQRIADAATVAAQQAAANAVDKVVAHIQGYAADPAKPAEAKTPANIQEGIGA